MLLWILNNSLMESHIYFHKLSPDRFLFRIFSINCKTKSNGNSDLRLVWLHNTIVWAWLNFTCHRYVNYFQYLWLWIHISFIAIHFGKLSKSLTRLANIYSSSKTPVALPDSFDNCCTCSVSGKNKHSSRKFIFIASPWVHESTGLQSAKYIRP